MPNYLNRPDKWHLMIPMFIFYPILIFIALRVILIKLVKSQKIEILAFAIINLIALAMLNNPKGNSQMIGYLILLITLISSIARFFNMRSKNYSS